MKSFKEMMRELMNLSWQLVRKNGYTMSEAMKVAWANIKLKVAMRKGIVRFYFRKVDGTVREAWGTLAENLIPAVAGTDTRKKNDTVQVYFDTERGEHGEWRCFKKANLLSIA